MRLYQLDRAVIRVSGNAEKFLNGLTSNTLDQPENAFLNIHGRIIATFAQTPAGADEFLIVLGTQYADRVLDHLERYALLNKTRLTRETMDVFFDLDDAYSPGAGEFVIRQKKGRMALVLPGTLKSSVTEEEFTLFRVQNGIPLMGVDYQPEEFLLNVSESDHVSFTKGCFLGQEPVSKVHNRSRPTWKLAVQSASGRSEEELAKMTSRVHDPASGQVCGFCMVKNAG